MSKQKIKKLIPIIFLLLICLVLIYIYTIPTKQNSPPPNLPQASKDKQEIGQIILEINGKKIESEASAPISIYDFMQKLKIEGKMDFKEKTYTGMGKLIEEINGIKNSGEKNWIYYVNGQKANIGVSNYKINNGDIVSWKYETNN